MTHTPVNATEAIETSLHCGSGCVIPDMTWRQYYTNCIIPNAPGFESHNTIVGDSAAENVGVIHKLTVGLNGAKAGVDWYIDNFKVSIFERNRDWVSGANLRIEEIRTRPVDLVLKNAPEGSTLEVKQARSKFGWGGRYSAWAFDTVLDQTFPYFFNQGFCVNEFKWQVVEKTKGVRDYTNGDRVSTEYTPIPLILTKCSLS